MLPVLHECPPTFNIDLAAPAAADERCGVAAEALGHGSIQDCTGKFSSSDAGEIRRYLKAATRPQAMSTGGEVHTDGIVRQLIQLP